MWLLVPSGTMPVITVSVPAATLATMLVIGATVVATRTGRPSMGARDGHASVDEGTTDSSASDPPHDATRPDTRPEARANDRRRRAGGTSRTVASPTHRMTDPAPHSRILRNPDRTSRNPDERAPSRDGPHSRDYSGGRIQETREQETNETVPLVGLHPIDGDVVEHPTERIGEHEGGDDMSVERRGDPTPLL